LQKRRWGILIFLSLCLSACLPRTPAVLPTVAALPTDAPITATATPMLGCEGTGCDPIIVTQGQIATEIPPSATSTGIGPICCETTKTSLPLPTSTTQGIILIGTAVIGIPTESALPATATLLPDAFQFGQSALGEPLTAYRYGTGGKIILLVGGIHTGYEANTVRLMRELQDHYTRNPNGVLPQISLVLVPVLNADGLAYGEQLRGRFNANQVDLNRNWACGWSANAVFKDQAVDAGKTAFSEPESIALGALVQQIHPQVVIFYHAAANGVFPGNCEGFVSDPLAAVYSAASGYPYSSDFADYTVTGSASGWVDSQRIPSIDVELVTSTETEIVENLQGIDGVQRWLAARP
jgi:murein peptide amidase A